jgi:hypothetical protein
MKNQVGRVAAVPNRQMDRADRMEAELTKWLGGLEPTGTPISLRFRTFADLRAEAALPRPRIPWLRSALSTMASLGSVVAGAGLLVLFAVIGATAQPGSAAGAYGPGLSGVGPGSASPFGGDYNYGPGPVAILMLLAASTLAGCIVLIPRLRRVVGRIAFGKSAAAPIAPLPYRRSWRSVTPIAWILVALAVGLTVESIRSLMTSQHDSFMLVLALDGMAAQTIALSIPLTVAWRYPLRDRSARLLLLGALAACADVLLFVAFHLAGGFPSWSEWFTLWPLVYILGFAALAAGMAGRAGAVRRPPRQLAALGVGATFMYATITLFMSGFGDGDFHYLLPNLLGSLSIWIVQTSWVAIMWVGIAAWRRGRTHWGWKLVLAAGAMHLLALAPNFISSLHQLLDPSSSSIGILGGWGVVTYAYPGGGDVMLAPEFWWQMVTNSASQIALLVALLIGLRPPATKPVEPTPEPADAGVDAGAPIGEPAPTQA